MRRGLVWWLAIAFGLMVAASACDGGETGTAIRLEVPDDGSAPAWGEAPFPSDAWRGADGMLEPPAGLEVVFHRDAELVAAHLAHLDGFGVRPLIEFPIDGAIDPTSIDGAALVVDVDPASPELGREIPYQWQFDPARAVLAGAPVPGEVLRSGTRYAALLTDQLRDADGRGLVRPAALGRLADAGERWQSTAEALTTLDRDDLVGIAVFTVQRATRTLAAARAVLDDESIVPPPELAFSDPALIFDRPRKLDRLLGQAVRFEDGPRAGQERWGLSGGTNPTGVAHRHVGVIATGTMTTARFRRADSEDDSPEDETFAVDPATGAPALVGIESIPITFVLPAGPPPSPAGYPVAVIAHGLGSSRHALLTFAEPLTAAGFAAVAIDADTHGSRRDPRDIENNFAPFLPDFAGERDMADGFGDRTGLLTTFDFLEGLRNMSGARDAIRQSVLDFSRVIQLLRSPDLDLRPLRGAYGGRVPRLDTTRIAYLGESFGTIVGGVLAAVEPEVDLYILDVAGAGMLDLSLCNAPVLATVVLPLSSVIFGIEGRMDRFHPAIGIMQSLIDAADPLTYAPHILRDRLEVGGSALGPRHVVVIEVVGDEVIHNVATESLARAMGLQVLSPGDTMPPGLDPVESPAAGNVDGQTGVMIQQLDATHGANWTSEEGLREYVPGFPHDGEDQFPKLAAPVLVTNPIYQTFEQVVELLASHQTGAAPRVTSVR